MFLQAVFLAQILFISNCIFDTSRNNQSEGVCKRFSFWSFIGFFTTNQQSSIIYSIRFHFTSCCIYKQSCVSLKSLPCFVQVRLVTLGPKNKKKTIYLSGESTPPKQHLDFFASFGLSSITRNWSFCVGKRKRPLVKCLPG